VISGEGLTGQTDGIVNHLDVHRTLLDLADIDAPSRGRNLFEITDGKSTLTEYHGLIPVAVRRLEEQNTSQEILETYDCRLSGVAVPPDYYGHETSDGYTGSGDAKNDPRTVMADLRESMSELSVEGDGPEMSEEVIDQLDDLGYV